MNTLDTNIIVRLFLDDNPDQADQAEQLIEQAAKSGRPYWISSVVLVELVWVLGTKGIHRTQIAEALTSLLAMNGLIFIDSEAVHEAVKLFATGKADFADYLIWTTAKQRGAQRMATFDKMLIQEQAYCAVPSDLLQDQV